MEWANGVETEGVTTEVGAAPGSGPDGAERHTQTLVEKLREEKAEPETFEWETVRV